VRRGLASLDVGDVDPHCESVVGCCVPSLDYRMAGGSKRSSGSRVVSRKCKHSFSLLMGLRDNGPLTRGDLLVRQKMSGRRPPIHRRRV
jgi:hypothetical protein